MAELTQARFGITLNSDELTKRIDHALKSESAALYLKAKSNVSRRPCKVPGCPNDTLSRGYCNAHYIRLRNGKPLEDPLQWRGSRQTCLVCSNPVDGKGGWSLCKPHYNRKRREIIKTVCVGYLGNKCADCGDSYPLAAFDFHHTDAAEKDEHPSSMMNRNSTAAIAAEVVKCVLLCANCHRVRHSHEG